MYVYHTKIQGLRMGAGIMLRAARDSSFDLFVFFSSSGEWGKIKLELTTLPRIFIRFLFRSKGMIAENWTRARNAQKWSTQRA